MYVHEIEKISSGCSVGYLRCHKTYVNYSNWCWRQYNFGIDYDVVFLYKMSASPANGIID